MRFSSIPIFLVVAHVGTEASLLPQGAFSQDQAAKDNPENDGLMQYLTIDTCEHLSSKYMASVVTLYPNVTIFCEYEDSILYPSELDGPEFMAERLKELPKPSWFESLFGSKQYYFTELNRISECKGPHINIPLFPCSRANIANGTSSSEVSFTLSFAKSKLAGISGGVTLPRFGLSTSLLPGKAYSNDQVIDFTCKFQEYGTRPFMRFATTKVTVKSRLWTVDATRDTKVQKYDWTVSQHESITDDSASLSCISEMYVAGVCEWIEEQREEDDYAGESDEAETEAEPSQHISSSKDN